MLTVFPAPCLCWQVSNEQNAQRPCCHRAHLHSESGMRKNNRLYLLRLGHWERIRQSKQLKTDSGGEGGWAVLFQIKRSQPSSPLGWPRAETCSQGDNAVSVSGKSWPGRINGLCYLSNSQEPFLVEVEPMRDVVLQNWGKTMQELLQWGQNTNKWY